MTYNINTHPVFNNLVGYNTKLSHCQVNEIFNITFLATFDYYDNKFHILGSKGLLDIPTEPESTDCCAVIYYLTFCK